MLTFKSNDKLLGCGIDVEFIDRFARWKLDGIEPSPMIFSSREIEHYSSLTDQSVGLCTSFCCKEAIYKALQRPYNFTDCELFWKPGAKKFTINLSDKLQNEYQITEPLAWVNLNKSGECHVQVFLLGNKD